MYMPTSSQRSLFEIDSRLPESIRRRLKGSWAEGFAQKVLPVLLGVEEEFSTLYCSDNGRPNWSVARMLGISILQEMQNMSDQQALDCLSFDVRWQHSLGMEPEQSYLSRRSLVDFRSRLVLVDPEMKMIREVFNRVGDAAINSLKISTTEQRIDSTIVVSNISTFGRLDLFKKTLVKFLTWVKSEFSDEFVKLGKPMRIWLQKIDDNGWFGSVAKLKQSKKRELLSTLAHWLYEIETVFASNESINGEEPYLLVKRLVDEHCEILPPGEDHSDDDNENDDDDDNDRDNGNGNTDDDHSSGAEHSKIKVLKKVRNPSASMQSPHDPDAGYSGHKGPGYFVHVTETCNNETTEVITDFFVEPACTDINKDQIAIDNLKAAGKQPEVLYEDAGYPTAQGMLDAKGKGTQIVAPLSTKGKQAEDAICRDQFSFDSNGNCTSCPEGHAPDRHGMRTSSSKPNKALHAFFNADTCASCELQGRCMVRPPNSKISKFNHIEIDSALVERDRQRAKQKDSGWWDDYSIRGGIEATMSEVKRVNGMGKLRVRRITRVTLAVGFKITACNVKRWIKASSSADEEHTDGIGTAVFVLFVANKPPASSQRSSGRFFHLKRSWDILVVELSRSLK